MDVQCSIAPIRSNGRVDGAVLVVHDITYRKRAEEALRRSEDLFSAIFRQAIVGITEIDLTGRFLMINDRFCEIVGRPREEVLTLTTQDITHADDVPNNMAMLERARITGEDYQLEKRYFVRTDRSSGSTTAFRSCGMPMASRFIWWRWSVT